MKMRRVEHFFVFLRVVLSGREGLKCVPTHNYTTTLATRAAGPLRAELEIKSISDFYIFDDLT